MITYDKKDIPSYLQNYFEPAEIGLEQTPETYIAKLVALFHETRRILKSTGTLWLNLGDTYIGSGGYHSHSNTGIQQEHPMQDRPDQSVMGKYHGLPPKSLAGIPWRTALALQADGWLLRQDIIWQKRNCLPASVKDRCVTNHEYVFLLAKSPKYYFDYQAIQEPISASYAKDLRPHGIIRQRFYPNSEYVKAGMVQADADPTHLKPRATLRRKRSVWTTTLQPLRDAHFATFPEALITPMVLAGCPPGGVCLDPFMGAGTVAVVAKRHGRNYLGIELNDKYIAIAQRRIDKTEVELWT